MLDGWHSKESATQHRNSCNHQNGQLSITVDTVSIPQSISSPILPASASPLTHTKQRHYIREIRRPPPRHRIPPHLRRKARRVAPRRRPTHHVRKRFIPIRIQPRIDEPQRRLPRRDQRVVHQSQHPRRRRGGGTRPVDLNHRAVPHRRVDLP